MTQVSKINQVLLAAVGAIALLFACTIGASSATSSQTVAHSVTETTRGAAPDLVGPRAAKPCTKFFSQPSTKQGCKRSGVPTTGATRLRDDRDLFVVRPSDGDGVAFPRTTRLSRVVDTVRVDNYVASSRGAPFWSAFSRTSSLLY